MPGDTSGRTGAPYDGDPSACMKVLDAMRWAEGVAFVHAGITVGIRVSGAGMLDRIGTAIPPGARLVPAGNVDFLYSVTKGNGSDHEAALYTVYSDTVPLVQTPDPDGVAAAIAEDLGHLVHQTERGRLIIRAGSVGWEGKAILVLGPRSSGRSTLVAGLLWAGATYFGDELTILSPEGEVYPFVRPLSLRCGVTAEPMRLADIGATAGTGPVPIGAVVATVYRPEATWVPKGLGLADAAGMLAERSLTGQRDPAALRSIFERMLKGVRRFSGDRGEAGEVIFRILSGFSTVFGGEQPAHV